MGIVSAALQASWAIIYFVWIYKGDTVYYGWGTTEEGYVKWYWRVCNEAVDTEIFLRGFAAPKPPAFEYSPFGAASDDAPPQATAVRRPWPHGLPAASATPCRRGRRPTPRRP